MSKTVRLTMAQALIHYLAALKIEDDDGSLHSYVGGVWAIFGHGNVAGLGEAMASWRQADSTRQVRPEGLPVFRAHNEQGMAHAAIAYGKANMRRRIMAVSSSIGPGAANMVTAAALAHVNRLPVLLLPGDIFASRAPDPVLQQSEDFAAGDISVNDCFRSVSRYFDRIMRPEQILTALPRAIAVLTDPAICGPVTLALPQDVQSEAFDCPIEFLSPAPIRIRRPRADDTELQQALKLLASAKRPMIIAGGGTLYSGASQELAQLAQHYGIAVVETQAGKSSLAWDHACNAGAVGVTGSPAANYLAEQADVVIGLGTRLQDFTSASNTLLSHARVLSINVQPLDATRNRAQALIADAKTVLQGFLQEANLFPSLDPQWKNQVTEQAKQWRDRVQTLTTQAVPANTLPYDAEVIGAVRDSISHSATKDVVVCAAGTLPAELHKLWRAAEPGNYHMDYGFSCMGYEIAGSLGVKMARPEQEVIVMVGDGSYMMMNSEIASAQMLGLKIIIVVLDNRGYGCINRLQRATGSPNYNNLLEHCVPENGQFVQIDFAAHAQAMGAHAVHVDNVAQLKEAMVSARQRAGVSVMVIDTTPERTTDDGGAWWEVGIPAVSDKPAVNAAFEAQKAFKAKQRV